jgi:hypothetical protein
MSIFSLPLRQLGKERMALPLQIIVGVFVMQDSNATGDASSIEDGYSREVCDEDNEISIATK